MSSFNPTLVRLRLRVFRRARARSSPFQSHAGSIEARICEWVSRRPSGWFQSHAGSIEAEFYWEDEHRGHIVSIPRWFD